MIKLHLLPDADGYTMTEGNDVIGTTLEGGAGRYRRDKIGAAKTANVKWTLNPGQYQYWRAFYKTATQRGSLPFLCDLVGEDGCGPAEHICQFVPGSVTLPEQHGLTYVQQATLEVLPLPTDEEYDADVILLYETFGDDADSALNALAHLVNVTAPGTIGA